MDKALWLQSWHEKEVPGWSLEQEEGLALDRAWKKLRISNIPEAQVLSGGGEQKLTKGFKVEEAWDLTRYLKKKIWHQSREMD